MDYDNSNKGAVWKNDKKQTDTHPDYTGSINVEGVDYWLSGWKKAPDASENAPLVKFSVKRKDAPKQAPQQDGGFDNSFDDDAPAF